MKGTQYGCVHVLGVCRKGCQRGKHTHIGCVLVDGMCRMAMSRKTHPEVRFSVRRL